MVWHKMKNVVILLLLTTNLFLGALVLSQEVKVEGQEQQARKMALEFLSDHNISISETLIPEKIQLPSQEMVWNRSFEKEYATALLGNVSEESLGGDILRYESAIGELRFHDNGEFYATFYQNSYKTEVGEEASLGEEILTLLNFTGQLKSIQQENNDTSSLTFLQTLDGIPLLGCEVTLLFEKGVLLEISQGKRLDGDFAPTTETNITVATSLIQFFNGLTQLGDHCDTIHSITPSYLVSTPLASSATLTPGWRMETNLGTYHLNTLDGTLLNLSYHINT